MKDGRKVYSLCVGVLSEYLCMKCGEFIYKVILVFYILENYFQLFQYGLYSGSLVVKSEFIKFFIEEYGDIVNCDDIWFIVGVL